MQWYATLIDRKNLRVRDYLDQVRLSFPQPSSMVYSFFNDSLSELKFFR